MHYTRQDAECYLSNTTSETRQTNEPAIVFKLQSEQGTKIANNLSDQITEKTLTKAATLNPEWVKWKDDRSRDFTTHDSSSNAVNLKPHTSDQNLMLRHSTRVINRRQHKQICNCAVNWCTYTTFTYYVVSIT